MILISKINYLFHNLYNIQIVKIIFESDSNRRESRRKRIETGVWFTIFNRTFFRMEKPVVFKPFFYYWVRFKILNPGIFYLAKNA